MMKASSCRMAAHTSAHQTVSSTDKPFVVERMCPALERWACLKTREDDTSNSWRSPVTSGGRDLFEIAYRLHEFSVVFSLSSRHAISCLQTENRSCRDDSDKEIRRQRRREDEGDVVSCLYEFFSYEKTTDISSSSSRFLCPALEALGALSRERVTTRHK